QPLAQYYQPKEWRDGWIVGTDIYDPANYARRLQEATDLYAGKEPKELFPFWAIWPDPATADEMAQLHTNLSNYIKQNIVQFITGSKSLDSDWEGYVKGLDQLGLSRYLEIQQKAYDAYLKKAQTASA
ncbi:MAG TPA: hypothetical protein VFF52_11215, partial [Isosphaeraceae bacterium]|nr:hypothetical protein [Isosphaeraceae bacterium]